MIRRRGMLHDLKIYVHVYIIEVTYVTAIQCNVFIILIHIYYLRYDKESRFEKSKTPGILLYLELVKVTKMSTQDAYTTFGR